MAAVASYYGKASEKMIKWIQADTNRVRDFWSLAETDGCATIQDYLNRYAYRQTVMQDLIMFLMNQETKRLITDITRL